MTNAEKYEAVFGFMPDLNCCPTENCEGCPAEKYKSLCSQKWWQSEYDDQTPINTEGDLISRKELIKALDGRANWLGQMALENLVALNFYSLVNSMPAVDIGKEVRND